MAVTHLDDTNKGGDYNALSTILFSKCLWLWSRSSTELMTQYNTYLSQLYMLASPFSLAKDDVSFQDHKSLECFQASHADADIYSWVVPINNSNQQLVGLHFLSNHWLWHLVYLVFHGHFCCAQHIELELHSVLSD